jgi:riboflavin kinase/FMN adenylyltransferase
MEVLTLTAPGRDGGWQHEEPPARSRVAIGTFDGVHLGHRRVLSGCDTALTFDPHPLRVIQPRLAPRLLTDHDQKLRKLRELGIRRVAIVPFDRDWSEITAEEFVEEVVVGRLGGGFVSVGEGFRFGARGTGTTTTLGNHPSLRTRVVPLVTHGAAGVAISSTRIRGLVALGDVAQAASLLGEPLRLTAVAGPDGGLSIAPTLALPAAGRYRGLIDRRECPVHVRTDGRVDAPLDVPDGHRVQLSFLERLSRQPAMSSAPSR